MRTYQMHDRSAQVLEERSCQTLDPGCRKNRQGLILTFLLPQETRSESLKRGPCRPGTVAFGGAWQRFLQQKHQSWMTTSFSQDVSSPPPVLSTIVVSQTALLALHCWPILFVDAVCSTVVWIVVLVIPFWHHLPFGLATDLDYCESIPSWNFAAVEASCGTTAWQRQSPVADLYRRKTSETLFSACHLRPRPDTLPSWEANC
mmetsp:Transcript_13381/g.29494  ORF Transcript_13381/g.29494 Transcript_13381/m.29494 type:complete len:203 (+) Transcript_13381:82-690(+)